MPTKKSQNKRILFVINTLGRAGAETALLELMDQFSGEEYRVDLLVLMGQGELVGRLPAHVHLLNRHFSKETVFSAKGRFLMAGTVMKACLARGTVFRCLPYLFSNFFRQIAKRRIQIDKLLWRILSDGCMRTETEYDLAVSFIEGASAYYVADHVKAKRKACFVHIDYQMAGYTRELDRDCYLSFDKVFPISSETEKSFLEVYPECTGRTKVFHNIVNQKKILEKADLPGGFEDDYRGTRLLTVGRLNKQKAYPVAIEAMKLLKDAGVEARWYVLGEGEERKALEDLIRERELTQDFLLLGAKENPYPYYKQTDLYIHATAFEGKSIAIQEAQTLGCTILASDIISNRQQIEDGTDGLLCELKPESIKEAVVRLLKDQKLAQSLSQAASAKNVSFEEDLSELLALL